MHTERQHLAQHVTKSAAYLARAHSVRIQVEIRASLASGSFPGRKLPAGHRWLSRVERTRAIEARAQKTLHEAHDALSQHDMASLPPVAEFHVAKCGCGARYTAKAWAELPCIGTSTMGGLRLEQRNCECGSTQSVECCSNCDADYAGCEGCDGPERLQYTGLGGDCTNCGEEEREHSGREQLCRPSDVAAYRWSFRAAVSK
jgi:hypothetical protein